MNIGNVLLSYVFLLVAIVVLDRWLWECLILYGYLGMVIGYVEDSDTCLPAGIKI